MKATTNTDFKKRASNVHNGKYIYDKTDLNNRDENGKVIITCPIHGDFKQDPNNHLRGIGCGKCANNTKKNSQDVINEIKSIYGDRYLIPEDFEYVNNKTPLHIVCPKHGDFYPTYMSFVGKQYGCKKCSCHIYENNEFIKDIKKQYGDLLNYDDVKFKGYRNKICVKCTQCGREHNIFPQRLLNGHFACECRKSPYTILEKNIAEKLAQLNIEYKYQYKEDWLKYKEPLSIDFYLPKFKIGIECQGRFHFEPYKKEDKKSLNEYKEQTIRDKTKYQLCKENSIKLLYYSNIKVPKYFTCVHNNIDEIIKEINDINYGKQC